MSVKLICSAILLFIIGFNCEDGFRHYNGYSVLRLIPKTKSQLNYLRELENNVIDLDFWKGPTQLNRAVDVMVPPHLNYTFNKIFRKRNFEKTVLIDDLEKRIEEERAYKPIKLESTRADIIANYFDNYQRISNVYAFLAAIQSGYPSISSVVTIGQSYGSRDLRLIKIGVNQASNTKPVIFLEAGIHAREWISPATAQCFAQNLVQGYAANDADIVSILNKFDFYILPVTNVDGYEYTHTNDRMWRKTRKPYTTCYGADPNRNFGYQWGGQGASTNPCNHFGIIYTKY
jgi:murein tripeptide amidase MpaA